MIVSAIFGDFVKLAKSGKFEAVAHGCNCFNTMGAGIAPLMAKAFDGLAAADNATRKGDRRKLGTYTSVADPVSKTLAINAYTQYTYWNPDDLLSYEAVRKVFRQLNLDLPSNGINQLAIPAIGAGLAKGDWAVLTRIINEETPNLDVVVVIWDKESDKKLVTWCKDFKKPA